LVAFDSIFGEDDGVLLDLVGLSELLEFTDASVEEIAELIEVLSESAGGGFEVNEGGAVVVAFAKSIEGEIELETDGGADVFEVEVSVVGGSAVVVQGTAADDVEVGLELVGCDGDLAFVVLKTVDLVEEGETVVESDEEALLASEVEWLGSGGADEIDLLVVEPEVGGLWEAEGDFESIEGVSIACDGADVAVFGLEFILLGIALGFG
jgi:hypothetical protein